MRAHMAALATALILGGTGSGGAALAGQEISDPIGQGVREPTDGMLDRIADVGFAPGELRFVPIVIPSYQAGEGSSVYGTTLGLKIAGFAPNLGVQVRAVGRVIDVGDDSRSALGGDVKLSHSGDFPISAAVKGSFLRTGGVANRLEGELALDARLYRGGFHAVEVGLSARVRSNSPDAGARSTGEMFAAGLSWSLGSETELLGAYEFDNELSGEDSFSLSVAQRLPRVPATPLLIVTAGKHRRIAVSLALVL